MVSTIVKAKLSCDHKNFVVLRHTYGNSLFLRPNNSCILCYPLHIMIFFLHIPSLKIVSICLSFNQIYLKGVANAAVFRF